MLNSRAAFAAPSMCLNPFCSLACIPQCLEPHAPVYSSDHPKASALPGSLWDAKLFQAKPGAAGEFNRQLTSIVCSKLSTRDLLKADLAHAQSCNIPGMPVLKEKPLLR